MLAVYIPIIRHATNEFVQQWNRHKIEKSRQRPHVVSGKPVQLYNYSDAPDCGSIPDKDLLYFLRSEVEDWGMFSYQFLLFDSNSTW